jgi:hypothetical protein
VYREFSATTNREKTALAKLICHKAALSL